MKRRKYIIGLVIAIILLGSFPYLSSLKVKYDVYKSKGRIDLIANPTKAHVFEILENYNNAEAFSTLENPTDEQKLRAIELDPDVLEYIENPTDEMILKAISIDGNAIQWLKYQPSLEIMLAAVRQEPSAVRHIYGYPPEEVLLEAVKLEGKVLSKIRQPSENVMLTAIDTDVKAFQSIDEPSEAVIQEKDLVEAILNDSNYVQSLENPTEKELEHIIFIDPFSILHIENPSEALQLAALDRNWTIGKDIPNLTPKAKTFYEEMKNQAEATYKSCVKEKTNKYKGAEYVEGELLVTFKPNMRDSDKIQIINNAGYKLKSDKKISSYVVLSDVPNLEEAICELEPNPMIRYVELNFVVRATEPWF